MISPNIIEFVLLSPATPFLEAALHLFLLSLVTMVQCSYMIKDQHDVRALLDPLKTNICMFVNTSLCRDTL